MKPTDQTLDLHPHITDVEVFFTSLTKAYGELEHRLQYLVSTAQMSPPAEVFNQCSDLAQYRTTLADLDRQMFTIIDLAGEDIVNTSMIHECRQAIAKASLTCSDLHQTLLTIREKLQADYSARLAKALAAYRL